MYPINFIFHRKGLLPVKFFGTRPALAGSIGFFLSFLLPVFAGQVSTNLPLFLVGAITIAGLLIGLVLVEKKRNEG